MAGRHLHHLQTTWETSNLTPGRSCRRVWAERGTSALVWAVSCIIHLTLCFSSFLTLTWWRWTCAACGAAAGGPEPVLRTWQRWEEAVGTARADCTSSTTGDGAEERARMLPPGRVRKTQTSYWLHPMLKCLCAFSLQHLAEVTYMLA